MIYITWKNFIFSTLVTDLTIQNKTKKIFIFSQYLTTNSTSIAFIYYFSSNFPLQNKIYVYRKLFHQNFEIA